MDDIIIASSDFSSISAFKSLIDARSRIKDLWHLKFFLGLKVARSAKGISVCQRKFVSDVLTDSDYLGSRPTKTPIEQNHKLDSSIASYFLMSLVIGDSLAGCCIFLRLGQIFHIQFKSSTSFWINLKSLIYKLSVAFSIT